MKGLEDFFEKNREAFDDLELPLGHEERFLKKLKKGNWTTLRVKWWYGIAASLIFLVAIGFFAKEIAHKSKSKNNQTISLGDISPKYQEVEEFYQAGVNEKIEEFEKLNCNINDEQKLMIDKELKQLNGSYKALQKELSVNKNDERIINAMINNYQNRISLLEQVIYQIKNNC